MQSPGDLARVPLVAARPPGLMFDQERTLGTSRQPAAACGGALPRPVVRPGSHSQPLEPHQIGRDAGRGPGWGQVPQTGGSRAQALSVSSAGRQGAGVRSERLGSTPQLKRAHMNPDDTHGLYSDSDAPGSPGVAGGTAPRTAPPRPSCPASPAVSDGVGYLDSSGSLGRAAAGSEPLPSTMREGLDWPFQAAQDHPFSPGPTSLVICSESVSGIDPEKVSQIRSTLCPTRPQLLVSSFGKVVSASCDSYRCPTCGPRKARTKSAIITEALRHPDCWSGRNRPRLLTLTKLPTLDNGELDYQRARWQIRDFARRLRSNGYRCETARAIERNPKDTGFHAHLIEHGDYIPQRELQDMWGGRRVDIRAIDRPEAGTYAIKEAAKLSGYVLKNGREDFSNLQEHLRINGRSVVEFSRGFLHGLNSRETLSLASEAFREPGETWRVVAIDAERFPEFFGAGGDL